jgi:hypothetical protein
MEVKTSELINYAHRNLIEHLAALERFADIHDLLARETKSQQNAWRSIKDDSGDMSGYIADVSRAWAWADAGLGSHDIACTIGLQVYYGALTASINSIAATIPGEILVALVNKGVLIPDQARIYAERTPNETQAINSLTKLSPLFSGQDREAMLRSALSQAMSIALASGLDPLVELLPFLDENLRSEAVNQILAVTRNRFDDVDQGYPYALNLLRFVPFLASPERENLLRDILSAVCQAKPTYVLADGLSRIAQYMPSEEREPLMSLAYRMALKTQYGSWRDYSFACIAERQAYIGKGDDALRTVKAIADDLSRAGALASMVQYLRPEQIVAAWQMADMLSDSYRESEVSPRARALCKIAPYYPEPTRDQAVQEAYDAVQVVTDRSEWANLLLELIPHLSGVLREEALAETFNTVINEPDVWARNKKLGRLAPLLSEVQLKEILSDATVIGEWSTLYSSIGKLILRLPRSKQPEMARSVTCTLRNVGKSDRLAVVNEALADCMPRPQRAKILSEALSWAEAISKAEHRINALTELAPRLSEPAQSAALSKALNSMETVEDVSIRSMHISDVARYLPEQLVYQAIEMAQRLPSVHPWGGRQSPRDQALKDLTVRLGELGKLSDALELTLELGEEDLFGWGTNARAFVLSRVVRFLPLETLKQALEVVRKLTKPYWRGTALAAVALRFDNLGQRADAVSISNSIEHEYWHAYALAGMLARVEASDRDIAVARLLRTAKAFDQKEWRVALVVELLPYISDWELPEVFGYALAQAQAISHHPTKLGYLRRLAPYFAKLPQHTMISLWSEAIHAWARGSRSQFVECLSELAPVIRALAGTEGVREVAEYLQKVDYWWP